MGQPVGLPLLVMRSAASVCEGRARPSVSRTPWVGAVHGGNVMVCGLLPGRIFLQLTEACLFLGLIGCTNGPLLESYSVECLARTVEVDGYLVGYLVGSTCHLPASTHPTCPAAHPRS